MKKPNGSNGHAFPETLLKPLLEFPCDFTLKVFGKMTKQFEQAVVKTMKTFFPKFSKRSYLKRSSRDNNYLALSITIFVTSRKQLDEIYQALHDCKEVLLII